MAEVTQCRLSEAATTGGVVQPRPEWEFGERGERDGGLKKGEEGGRNGSVAAQESEEEQSSVELRQSSRAAPNAGTPSAREER